MNSGKQEQRRFENCGVCLLSSTQKSLRLEINIPNQNFPEIYYIGINDLEAVLNKRKKTATILKIHEETK